MYRAAREHRPRRRARSHLRIAAWPVALLLAACGAGTSEGEGGGGSGGPLIRRGGYGGSFTAPVEFIVANHHSAARTETIRASIPFSPGAVTSLQNVGVRGMQSAWLPLQQWPDGSVRVAQVQFTDSVEGSATNTYEVVQSVSTLTGPFKQNNWVAQLGANVRIKARVRDTFNVPYEAVVSGAPETVQETFLVRVQRYRLYHQPAAQPNIGRDFLTSTFYVTEFQDLPFLTVDWIVGNDYLGADDTTGKTVRTHPNWFPLGSIDLNSAEFMIAGAREVRPYLGDKNGIASPVQSSGWTSFKAIDSTYIDDGQTRRYRFLVRVTPSGLATETENQWKEAFAAFAEEPLAALATLSTWQRSRALGLHGGPIEGPGDSFARAQGEYESWNNGVGATFGTWGDFGEIENTGQTGTPRNTPVSVELAHAVQGMNPRLLRVLEQKAWVQAVRPYHLWGLVVGTHEDILLWDPIPYIPGGRDLSKESLGRRGLWANDPYPGYRTRVEFSPFSRAHGWNGYDHEHWTTDLLFDYWSISGDAWAKEELRQIGESLRGLMRISNYSTQYIQAARAEGWCMTGFVHVWLATGDSRIRDYALLRIASLDQQRSKTHPSKCFAMQSNYAGTGYPMPHEFYMPWQHGPVLYGFLASNTFFEDPVSLEICEDVVPAIDYAWVTNITHPWYGFVPEAVRYYVPTSSGGNPVPANYFDASLGVRLGSAPLGGELGFLTGGLFMLAERTQDSAIQRRALEIGGKFLGTLNEQSRWYKWHLAVLEYMLP